MEMCVKYCLSGGNSIIVCEIKPIGFYGVYYCTSNSLRELNKFIAKIFWHIKN